MPKCRPGDLAVVVSATHRCNLGKIVHVIRLHDGRGDIVFQRGPHPVWWIRSPKRLKWTSKGRVYWRLAGPVPDIKLQPIRGADRSLPLPQKERLRA